LKKVTVTIDGKEYRLRSDDEELLLLSAELVNEQMDMLKIKRRDDLPAVTLPVLAALNIAGRELEFKKKTNDDIDFLIKELSNMADKLESALRY
jgi:cell division protein ZapA (FtsZ GTPase activity inhibitor)